MNVRGDLRNACMELLHTIWTAKGDTSYIIEHFDAIAFIRFNIISATSATARIGSRLLSLAAQLSPKLKVFHVLIYYSSYKDIIFNACLESLEVAADQAVSSTSVDLIFSLISQFWNIAPSAAHNK